MLIRLLPQVLLGLILSIVYSSSVWAQLGIGTTTPHSSAALDVSSSEQGLLPPRMSTSQRDSINGGNFAEGLMIYNTDEKCLQYWNGSDWKCKESSSVNSSSSFINKGPDKKTPHVFALDDVKTQTRQYYANPYMTNFLTDFTWLDNESFAVASSAYTCPNNNFSYPNCKGVPRVTIYDLNFGKIKQFDLDFSPLIFKELLEGTGHRHPLVRMVRLKNGNLAIFSPATGCSYLNSCSAITIVDLDGNTVVSPKTFNTKPQSGIYSPSLGSFAFQYVNGLMPLENGGMILALYYDEHGSNYSVRKTWVFDDLGNKVKENTEVRTHGERRVFWATTSYGYIALKKGGYAAYDFSGNLIKNVSLNVDENILLGDSNNAVGRNLIKSRYGLDDFYFLSAKGIFKFNAGKDSSKVYYQKLVNGSYKPLSTYLYRIIGGEINQENFIYLSGVDSVKEKDEVKLISVFYDGTPFIHPLVKYNYVEHRISMINNKTQNLSELMLMVYPPSIRIDLFNFSYFWGFSDYYFDRNILEVSPDGKHLMLMGEIQVSTKMSVFDISADGSLKKRGFIAKSNGVNQHLGKRFALISPTEKLKEVRVKIESGYKNGDKISSYCTPTTVACINVTPELVVISSSDSTGGSVVKDFITALNEVTFNSSAASGIRVIEVQATSDTGGTSEVLKFELNVAK